jgi:hypothetical protein
MISEQQRKSNRLEAMKFFVASDFTPVQAAGIVGNLMQESGMQADVHEYGSGLGYGLAQWTTEDRKRGLVNYAISKRALASDFNLQLQFIIVEFGQPSFHRAKSRLLAAETVIQATTAVSMYYEMPGIPRLGKRINYAHQALEEYQDYLQGGEKI